MYWKWDKAVKVCVRWLFASVAAALLLVQGEAATITATVDRPVISLGENVTLSLRIDGAQGQQPQLPQLSGFNVIGQGASMQISGGVVQQTFNYILAPTRTGDLVIPALSLNLGGQVAGTHPILVKVVAGAEGVPGPPPASANIVLSKTNLYVGEVVDAEVQVLFQEGRIGQYPILPADPGFTVGKWLQPTQARTAISNVAYQMVSFKAPITAVKTGVLKIGPATQPIVIPDRSRRSLFFQNEKELRVVSPAITAIGLPLPSNNVPPTFAGAVGRFAVSLTASPTNVNAGDPITVRIQISGRGWLDAVTLPQQTHWRDFKSYAPNSRIDSGDPNNINGNKVFEMAVIPQTAEIKFLPAFNFTYFDPDAKAYQTVSTPAVPLTVAAGSGANVPLPRLTATNAATGDQPASDIAHIKLRLGTATATRPLVTQPWFLVAQLMAPALWIGLVLRRRRAEALASNPRRRRQLETQSFVRGALAELRGYARENKSDEFFRLMFRVLQEQIAERTDLPAHSITEAVVDQHLVPAALPQDVAETLHELFQASNLARYAPVNSSQELTNLLDRVEQAVGALQEWQPKR